MQRRAAGGRVTGRWRRPLAVLRRTLFGVLACALIALAGAMGLAQLLLPLVASHPAWVQAELSRRLQRPVQFASMEGLWRGSGPRFVLHDLVIAPPAGQSGPTLRIPQAQFGLDLGAWALPSRHLFNLYASGLNLSIEWAADGSWQLDGLSTAGGPANAGDALDRLSLDVWLENLAVAVTDGRNDRHYRLQVPQLRLSLQHQRLRLGALLQRQGVAGQLRLAGEVSTDGRRGRLWLAGRQLDLPALLGDVELGGYVVQRGRGDLASWLSWRDGQLLSQTSRLDLRDLQIASPGGGQARIGQLQALAGLSRLRDGYQLRWAGSDHSALVADLHQPDGDQARVDVAARQLALPPLVPWLALLPDLPAGVSHWLGEGHPRGELAAATLHWDRAGGLRAAQLTLKDIGIDPVGAIPGIDRLSGELRGDGEAIALSLPPQATVLRTPQVFAKPFVLPRLQGVLSAWQDAEGWHLGAASLGLTGEGFDVDARGEVLLPSDGGRPFLDLYAHVNHGEVEAAKLFWPRTMPASAVNWLNRGLVGGHVVEGDALIRGSLADWPFRHHEGRFEARARIADTTLVYGDDWPRAEGIEAVASFVNNGMLVEATAGHSLGNQTTKAVAQIADFGDTTLDLTVEGNGSGASALQFIASSPIARNQADVLGKLKLGGQIGFGFHLVLPVKDTSQSTLEGHAQISNADLDAPDWKLKLGKLDGPMRFDLKGFSAGPLATSFRGQPAQLKLAIAAATGAPDTLLDAHLAGRFAIDQLTGDYSQLRWLDPLTAGQADFDIGLAIGRSNGQGAVSQTLTIDSPLRGVALKLPAPLQKPADTSLPLHVSLPLPVGGQDMALSLGDVLRGRLQLPDDAGHPLAASLQLGKQTPEPLPPQGLLVRGHAALLDATGWAEFVAGGSSSGDGPSVQSVDVSAAQTEVFGHRFANLRVQVTPQPEAVSVDVSGADMAGNISVPTVELRKRGITARLQRLHWPADAPSGGAAAAATPAPASAVQPATGSAAVPAAITTAGATAKSAAAVTPAVTTRVAAAADNPSAAAGIAPGTLPPMHMSIADLRLGDAKLGEARLETWPTAEGMHIDQLRALSHSVQIAASGDWNGTEQANQTHLRIDFAAQNLGEMLSAFGYANIFAGGKTRAELDATWPGPPSALSLATLDGRLSLNVTDGRIPEVPLPSVGRLFGLASLAEVPRRLSFDFGDVFGKGLAFDSISGDFHFANGNATTDNLKIHSPAAEISITGRTGLHARDYDQQMLVIPHVGNSLPVVGAVLAGPVGAAAGLAVQGLLGRAVNHVAALRYAITGSWDKPKLTLLEKRQVAVPSSAPPAPVATPLLPATAGSSANPR